MDSTLKPNYHKSQWGLWPR